MKQAMKQDTARETWTILAIRLSSLAVVLALLGARNNSVLFLIQNMPQYFSQTGTRLHLALSNVTRIDMLPDNAAALCDFALKNNLDRYFLEPSFKNFGPAYHRMIEGCWPKRVIETASHGFALRDNVNQRYPGCTTTDINEVITYVQCNK